MIFSENVWEAMLPSFERTLAHPFNMELARGTLDTNIFCFYLEQDSKYLEMFDRALNNLELRFGGDEHTQVFVEFFRGTSSGAERSMHDFLFEAFNCTVTGMDTPAYLSYTDHLLTQTASGSLGVAISALLPCFWIYMGIGSYIQHNDHNQYGVWLDTYVDSSFVEATETGIDMFNSYAEMTSEEDRAEMLKVCMQGALMEWQFFDDCYCQRDIS